MPTDPPPEELAAAPVAVLPMYDAPPLRAANDALWRWLAIWLGERGVAGLSPGLERGLGHRASWVDPRLILGQACEYPLATRYGEYLRPLVTPTYAAPGCGPGRYCSEIVVRADDPVASLAGLRGRVCAINERDSNSGMNLLRAALAPIAGGRCLFSKVQVTGEHAASARAVADGVADVAAIDCVTYAHLGAAVPELTGRLRVLARTASSPSLPFVTSRHTPPSVVRLLVAALEAAMATPDLAACRATLRLAAVQPVQDDGYATVRAYADAAAALGYPELC
jgi:ABC-type phosphate/phosphonate transport system substrate-binding protein